MSRGLLATQNTTLEISVTELHDEQEPSYPSTISVFALNSWTHEDVYCTSGLGFVGLHPPFLKFLAIS